jgi:2TM domain
VGEKRSTVVETTTQRGDAMTTTSDDDLRARAEARVKAREDFRIHLLIYVLVNGLLWAIWLTTDQNPGVPWPAFATVGWGIGLIAHWWTVYGVNEARREAEIQKEMRRLRGDPD